VTPETRAARDRIAAQLDRMTQRFDESDAVTVDKADLRLVLAALDQQPDAILISDAVLDQEQVEELRRRFLAAQHDETPIRALDEPERAACADCARPIQYIDHPGWPTGWMHILEAADHEARPQDNPA
jgi:hypothetical protein